MLFQDLTQTDIAIISAVINCLEESGIHPTASMIQKELAGSYPLKRTQLYDRLAHLRELGFLTMELLKHPRSYRVDNSSVTTGSREWLRRRKQVLSQAFERVSEMLETLEQVAPQDIASILSNEMTRDSGFSSKKIK